MGIFVISCFYFYFFFFGKEQNTPLVLLKNKFINLENEIKSLKTCKSDLLIKNRCLKEEYEAIKQIKNEQIETIEVKLSKLEEEVTQMATQNKVCGFFLWIIERFGCDFVQKKEKSKKNRNFKTRKREFEDADGY